MDYEQMTVEQLEAENSKLMARRNLIKAQQKEIAQWLDEKRAQQALAADIAALQEKHGVKTQVIKPAGVPSSETVTGG